MIVKPKYYRMRLRFSIQIIVFFFASFLFSQEKIEVVYEIFPFYEPAQKEDIELEIIPSLHSLKISAEESQYEYIPRIRNVQKEDDAKTGMTASIENRALGILYKNTLEKRFVEETQLNSKPYLIHDELPQIDWKITKETKQIGEFTAYKATAKLKDHEIEAWYAPKLTFKTGPDKYWGLPGLILELNETLYYGDGGKEGNLYKFISLKVMDDKTKIIIPTKGKIINQADFDKTQKEAFDKMMEMYGGGVDKD